MRIVMITDDVEIDRRILQEAESLIAVGHEVILIAGQGEGRPRFEWIDKIKVERFSPSDQLQPVFPTVGDVNFVKYRFAWIRRLEAWYLAYKVSKYWARLFFPYAKSIAVRKARSFAQAAKRLVGAIVRTIVAVLRSVRAGIRSVRARIRSALSAVRSGLAAALRHAWRGLSSALRSIRQLPRRPKVSVPVPVAVAVVETVAEPSALSAHERHLLACVRRYNPDVVHAHDLPMLGAAVHLKRELGVPVIYDAHELYPEICTLSAEDKARLDRKERELIRECDTVITVNPLIATEMANRYAIAEPAVVFNASWKPTGFDAKQPHALLREHFSISDRHQILLYQGWMSKTRGLQKLCAAMSGVREDVHLVFMGYGEAKEELEEIARSRNLTERVHFKSTVPQSELLFWTASADAGIIPYQSIDLNNYYCSPNKLFEFILAGLPIIGNDLPFLRSIIAGEGFGLVHRLDEESDYSAAINAMFDASAGGPARFRPRLLSEQDRYSWDVEKSKILDLYSRLGLDADSAKRQIGYRG
ncbi:glycosyltransferase [Bradyrhizobium mercantei]|uniref:glycosyltransferase n=1 Tax=Bradyrhizobium mercantei TaxID=1904807 RepID=UPI00097886BE|nr:glycosyltransferase [Bradyrhizobium mercantei]